MKKIAIVLKNLTRGGAEKQSLLLARALAGEYEIHFVILNGHEVNENYMALLHSDNRIVVHSFTGNIIHRIIQFCDCIRELSPYAIFSYLTMANLVAASMGRLCGCCRVYTGLRNARLPWLKLVADRYICNHLATYAISNSISGIEYFASKGFHVEKMIAISNCHENITPYTCKTPHEEIRIITVGRFVKQKDYRTAIKAIASLNSQQKVRFIIIGYGELEPQIRKWVREEGIENITEIMINPNNIPTILRDADIYISSSLFEGMSNAIMEAMNADLPIICTDVGDNNKLVVEGENGYICPVGNWKELADRTRYLVLHERTRVAFGRKSKEILEGNYDVAIFRANYIKLLQEKVSDSSKYE